MENKIDFKGLYQDCLNAREKSYAPYSNAHVGACLYTKDGKKVYGANIENASYGLTVCAERNCMFGSVIQGIKKDDITVLGICATFKDYAWPCGACRQVMAELLNMDTSIVVFNNQGEYKVLTVKDLLPYTFSKGDLR